MHDFLLAKQIADDLEKIIKEKKLNNIKTVSLEVGNISMSHDGHPEHLEEINLENLHFGLKNLFQERGLGKVIFDIKKGMENNWKILEIEVK